MWPRVMVGASLTITRHWSSLIRRVSGYDPLARHTRIVGALLHHIYR